MNTWWTRGVQLLGAMTLVAAATAGAACGGGGGGAPGADAGPAQPGTDGGGLLGDGGGLLGNGPNLTAITVVPATASIESLDGAAVTQAFTVQGTFDNGTTLTLTNGVSWSSGEPQIGSLSSSGLFTASGALGGVVSVQASYKGQNATASLTVKLHLEQNVANVPGNVQTQLGGASTPDSSIVWAYPYDGTVWPRGLLAPILQWNGGAATDDYYVHLKSPTFELDAFTTATGAPSSHVALDATTWEKFTDSTSGATQVTVARWNGTAATLIAEPHLDGRSRVDARDHLLLVEQPRTRPAHQAGRRAAGRLREPGAARRPEPVCAVELPDDVPHGERGRLDARQRGRRLRRQLQPSHQPAHRVPRRHVGAVVGRREQLVGRPLEQLGGVAHR